MQAEKREVVVPARQSDPTDPVYFHDRWIRSLEVPIYRGHFIEDLRTIELARWDERDCDVAFLQLEGQEFIQEVRIMEIAPGKTLPPYRIGLEEMVYVLKGRGQTTVWGVEGLPKKSFEWQERSIFMTPPGYYSQLSSLQGDQPARIMATSYLPLAFALRPDMDFFFKNPVVDLSLLYGEGQEAYSEAVAARNPSGHMLNLWVGNFFPDMKMWDKLEPYRHRGAGGTRVDFRSNFGRRGHMSVFPVGTYKRAHRHGPGRVIFIPDGEGYSIIWPQGGEKIVLPWHEASVFTPPNQWFHQHFNVGAKPARYIAFGPPRGPFETDEADDNDRQIDYMVEDPWIRDKFEAELAKRGLATDMPQEAYEQSWYMWKYQGDE